MSNKFSSGMPLDERQKKFLEMPDEEIDYSDIPPLDDEFFKTAKLVSRCPRTQQISIRVDTEILDCFKSHSQDKGYQTLIKDVLRTYVNHQS